jgi:cysteine synthase A
LGEEIAKSFERLDYLFVSVSSCGTITGLSKKLKEEFPGIKIIAVDVEGSVIFNFHPEKRFISGMGASIVPSILKNALIDEIIHISQMDIIKGCHELVNEQMIFGGASSGAAYFAIKKYFGHSNDSEKRNVLFLCPDRGDAYLDTVYNKEWISEVRKKIENERAVNKFN